MNLFNYIYLLVPLLFFDFAAKISNVRLTPPKKEDNKVMGLVDVHEQKISLLVLLSMLLILVISICMYIYCYIATSRFLSKSIVLLLKKKKKEMRLRGCGATRETFCF